MEGFVQNRFLFISRLFLVNGLFSVDRLVKFRRYIVPKPSTIQPKMLILVISESMTDEMDFKGVISVSDLGGIVLSYTKFSHCLNKFIQPPLKELDVLIKQCP